MEFAATRFRVGALLFSLTLGACSGSGQQAMPAAQIPAQSAAQQPQSVSASAPQSAGSSNFTLPPRGQGYEGTLITSKVIGRGNQLRVGWAPGNITSPCPAVPLVQLTNLTSAPITLTLQSLEIDVPCDAGAAQFGMSFFQLTPQPAVLQSNKFGDTNAAGTQISFVLSQQITLAPLSTSALTILPDPTGAEVALPVAPNSTSVLTSGKGSNIPTDLSFFYTSGQGASLYTTACFDASLLPANVPRVGRPSFFCHINPGTSSITFGTLVKFFIGVPKVDRSVLGLDGPSTSFICGTASTSTECDTSSFTVSNTSATAFQNVIVGNVDDLRACVPVTANTDCNSLVSPAPSTTSVSASVHEFELLVADDATYRPGAGPWDGIFRRAIVSGPCTFSTAPDSGDGPPGYTDSNHAPAGPLAELEVNTGGPGVCVISLSEDPKFIVADFSNPVNPVGRSVQLTITIH